MLMYITTSNLKYSDPVCVCGDHDTFTVSTGREQIAQQILCALFDMMEDSESPHYCSDRRRKIAQQTLCALFIMMEDNEYSQIIKQLQHCRFTYMNTSYLNTLEVSVVWEVALKNNL